MSIVLILVYPFQGCVDSYSSLFQPAFLEKFGRVVLAHQHSCYHWLTIKMECNVAAMMSWKNVGILERAFESMECTAVERIVGEMEQQVTVVEQKVDEHSSAELDVEWKVVIEYVVTVYAVKVAEQITLIHSIMKLVVEGLTDWKEILEQIVVC